MTTVNHVLTEVSKLLDRLNHPDSKARSLSTFFRHPIVITVVGSILITLGSNVVTKKFQLRDKQADAVASLQSEIPRELALLSHLAEIRSVLEEEKCDNKADTDKLTRPLVMGLTGKTCKEAEEEYLKYYAIFLKSPPGASLVKVRALFESPAVDEGAQKLGALLKLLTITGNSTCIVQIEDQADEAFDELMNLSIKEIDGAKSDKMPKAFDMKILLSSHCPKEDLCRVTALSKDPTLKLNCM